MAIKKIGYAEVVLSAVLVVGMLFAVTESSVWDEIPQINMHPPVKSDSHAISDFLV